MDFCWTGLGTQALFVTFIGDGFLSEHSGKGVLWWLENHGYPFPPSLMTAIVGIQQEETKVNPRGNLLPTSSLGRACPGPGPLAWVDYSHVQDICKLGVPRSLIFNCVMQMFNIVAIYPCKIYIKIAGLFLTCIIHFD